jgi:homoserine O-acetyltransferase
VESPFISGRFFLGRSLLWPVRALNAAASKIRELIGMPPSRIAACGVLESGISGPYQGGRSLRSTMGISRATLSAGFAAIFSMTSLVARAADYPTPKQGEWIAKDFKFHTGETMPELRLHYTTVGEPSGQPVLVLHGSGGSAASMLTPTFAGELFGPGQPLDATKYYIIIPDGIGHGKSSKPSDAMKTAFPKYDYADMVDAQYRLVAEGLGIKHLRLVIGNSMGGMHTWLWGVKYPGMMDALVPMASQPTAMAARNWILRRMMIETIRNDPDYKGGNYTEQPRMMKYAIGAYRFASAGGTLAYQMQAPTAEKADKMVDDQLALPVTADANDYIYQWDASHDFDPSAGLEKIEATVLAINAADDERNPPETGVTEAAVKRIKHGKIHLIPASTDTRGHLTTGNAKFYAQQLRELLQTAPQRTM